MRSVLVASLRHHTRRYVASSVAVVIGVAFIVITNALTTAAVSGLTADAGQPFAGTDVVIRGIDTDDAELLLPAADEAGAQAEPLATLFASISHGGRSLTDSGLVGVVATDEQVWQDVTSGRAPLGAGEALLDSRAAKTHGLGIGDVLRVEAGGRQVSAEVVGIAASSLHRSTTVHLPWEDLAGFSDALWFEALTWTGPTAAAERVVAGLPGASLVPTEEHVAALQREINSGVDVLAISVLLFLTIALVVATLVIANTFSILFAQRAREFALLRCVGATARQLRRSVRIEALVLGIAASTVGLVGGIAAGYAVVAATRALAPDAGLGAVTLDPVWLLGAGILGVTVTLVASWLPTRAVMRVSPLAALRPDVGPEPRSRAGLLRLLAGSVLLTAGCGLLTLAVLGELLPAMLLGGVVTVGGVLLLGPLFVPALIRGIGASVARLGPPARLATGNAVRNPRRAAATVASLLIGVTLATATLTGTASSRTSVAADLDRSYPLDLTVTALDAAVPDDVLDRLRRHPDIEAAVAIAGTTARLAGVDDDLALLAPSGTTTVVRGDHPELTSPPPGVVLLPWDLAAVLPDGERVEVSVGPHTLRLEARYGDGWGSAAVVAPATLEALGGSRGTTALWLRATPDADAQEVADDVTVLAQPVGAQVANALERRASIDVQLTVLVAAVLGLLGIAVVIALVGIGNTVGLSVLERTREFALLRALGLTRRQLHTTLATEGLLLATAAALVGTALGVLFAWVGIQVVVAPVVEDGAFVLPMAQLAATIAASAAAGVLACVLPARRAGRIAPAAGLAAT